MLSNPIEREKALQTVNKKCSIINKPLKMLHFKKRNISDKKIVSKSGFLELIKPEDNVAADHGFFIRDLLTIPGATFNIPPFSHGKQLSIHGTELTRRIARACRSCRACYWKIKRVSDASTKRSYEHIVNN